MARCWSVRGWVGCLASRPCRFALRVFRSVPSGVASGVGAMCRASCAPCSFGQFRGVAAAPSVRVGMATPEQRAYGVAKRLLTVAAAPHLRCRQSSVARLPSARCGPLITGRAAGGAADFDCWDIADEQNGLVDDVPPGMGTLPGLPSRRADCSSRSRPRKLRTATEGPGRGHAGAWGAVGVGGTRGTATRGRSAGKCKTQAREGQVI